MPSRVGPAGSPGEGSPGEGSSGEGGPAEGGAGEGRPAAGAGPARNGGGALLSPVSTEGAPAAIGPYVQGMSVAGGCRLVFTSGQLPLDPVTGQMAEGGVGEEAHQALHNALAILAAAGARPGDVVRSTIYLVDMGAYAEVNEVYQKVFSGHLPARTVVGVSALPRGASLEVELVAAVDG